MTTSNTNSAVKTPKSSGRYRLPDPPPREPDEMTSYDHVHRPGNSHHLIQHLGNPETTLVVAERWMVARPDSDKSRARRPDLMIAFDVDPELYRHNNGYIVSNQGKPPDFVLAVASVSTAHEDVGPKRAIYGSADTHHTRRLSLQRRRAARLQVSQSDPVLVEPTYHAPVLQSNPAMRRRGGLAQWESTCFASRGSGVRIP